MKAITVMQPWAWAIFHAGKSIENRTWRTIALTVVGFGEALDGNLKNARKYLLEALILNEQQGNLVYARASRGMLSWVSIEQGELHHATEQFRQMQAEARAREAVEAQAALEKRLREMEKRLRRRKGKS